MRARLKECIWWGQEGGPRSRDIKPLLSPVGKMLHCGTNSPPSWCELVFSDSWGFLMHLCGRAAGRDTRDARGGHGYSSVTVPRTHSLTTCLHTQWSPELPPRDWQRALHLVINHKSWPLEWHSGALLLPQLLEAEGGKKITNSRPTWAIE